MAPRLPLALAIVAASASATPALGEASGFTESLFLDHATRALPRSVPTMVAHTSSTFDPARPIEVVVFFHGWSGCVEVLVRPGSIGCTPSSTREPGWDLAGRIDSSGRNVLLLAPQLAYRARDGSAGRLARRGFVRAMIDEAMTRLGPLVGNRHVDDVERVTFVAHSAGYESALVAARHADLGPKLDRIALMDALYDAESGFLDLTRAEPGRSLVSLHTSGRTAEHGRRLAGLARRAFGDSAVAEDPADLVGAIRTRRVVVAGVPTGHAETLRRYLPDVLARP